MNQNYRDKLVAYIREDNKLINKIYDVDTEWDFRVDSCARRLLTAICFRENAENTYKVTKSVILPIIGFYYSMFHMSLALLSVEYTTEIDVLNKIPHNKLINLIHDKFIKRSIIDRDFFDTLVELRELRSIANYSFHEIHNLDIELYYPKTEIAFNIAIKFIKEVHNIIKNEYHILTSMEVIIFDGIGDDILSTYLSKNEIRIVEKYLENFFSQK